MKQIADNREKREMDIDELRYQRALALARYEMAKYHLKESAGSVVENFARPRGIMGRLLSSLNYIDYAVLAFRIGSKLMKLRRKR